MNQRKNRLRPRQASDPFSEREVCTHLRRYRLLGADVRVHSNDRRLADLADLAYANLPSHLLLRRAPRLSVELRLNGKRGKRFGAEPPPFGMHSGAGLLVGSMTADDFVIVDQAARRALVSISPQLLRFSYHARYELIEFSVFTLASRAQNLVPLHAACLSLDGRAVLILGDQGAGKSTLTLHGALAEMDFVTEDAAFVAPGSGKITGVANFLHIRASSLRFLSDPRTQSLIRSSPVIRRRSGVEKYEVDLRQPPFRLARQAPTVAAVVVLSRETASNDKLLKRLPRADLLSAFRTTQPYGMQQASWPAFQKRLLAIPAFELRRGSHPSQSVEAVRKVLSD